MKVVLKSLIMVPFIFLGATAAAGSDEINSTGSNAKSQLKKTDEAIVVNGLFDGVDIKEKRIHIRDEKTGERKSYKYLKPYTDRGERFSLMRKGERLKLKLERG